MSETKPGADIVADAREWLTRYGGREVTHSDGCHRWHDACLIARLVAECESRTGSIDAKAGAEATERHAQGANVPERERLRLTDAEREAMKKVLRRVREDYFAGRFSDSVEIAALIDGILERQGGER